MKLQNNTFDKSSISEIDKIEVYDENLDDDYSFYMRKGGLRTKMKAMAFSQNLTPDLNESKAVPFNSGQKRFFISRNDNSITSIGPAYYNVQTQNNNSNFIQKTHNKKGYGNSFISTTLRFENSKIRNLGPGPGQYFSETSSKRRNQLLKKQNVQHMFKQMESSNRYTKPKILPGPDHYNPKFDTLNFKNEISNCVFKSASSRFPSLNVNSSDKLNKMGLNFSSIPYKNYCNTLSNPNQLETHNATQHSRIEEIIKKRQAKNSSFFMQAIPFVQKPSLQDIKKKYQLNEQAKSQNQQSLQQLQQQQQQQQKQENLERLQQYPQKTILKAHHKLSACFAPCKLDRGACFLSKDQLENPGPGQYAYSQTIDLLRQKKELVSGCVFKSESAKFITSINTNNICNSLGPGQYSTDKLQKKKYFHFNLKNLWL